MTEARRARLEAAGVDVEAALERMLGSEALLERMLAKFLEDRNLPVLRAALEGADPAGAVTAAHTLKGVCGNLSMGALYGLFTRQVGALRQGDLAGAREAINEVRRRAGATELTSDSQMTVDFLLDERIRELVGEEQRRFTLLRLGKLLERTRKYNTEAGPAMKDYHVLWPIPQSIRDSNTDAEFPQNEGY